MSWWKKSEVMVVIGHLMRVALIDVDCIYDFVMCVTMIFGLGLMLGDDACNCNGIMGQASHIRRQDHAHRQNDGQCKVQECPCLSSHLPDPRVSARLLYPP
jgi:hypothetical protein